jgi:predicted HTH transcriptional regulator
MNKQQNIEFKLQWIDNIFKTVCAFANTNGGSIYIGIDDKGNPVELKDIKKLMEDIPNKIKNIIGIVPKVNLVEKDENCTSANLPEPEMSEEMNAFLLIIHKYEGGSEKIFYLISKNPYTTISEIANTLSITTAAVEKQIKKLQENNKSKRIGPAKGGHWEVVE